MSSTKKIGRELAGGSRWLTGLRACSSERLVSVPNAPGTAPISSSLRAWPEPRRTHCYLNPYLQHQTLPIPSPALHPTHSSPPASAWFKRLSYPKPSACAGPSILQPVALPPSPLIENLSFRVQFKCCHMLKSLLSPHLPPQAPTCFLSVSPHQTPFPVLSSVLRSVPMHPVARSSRRGTEPPRYQRIFSGTHVSLQHTLTEHPRAGHLGASGPPCCSQPPSSCLGLCTSPLGRQQEPPVGLALPVWETVCTLQTPCPVPFLLSRADPVSSFDSSHCTRDVVSSRVAGTSSEGPKAEVSWSSGSNLAPHSPDHWPLLPASNFSQGGLLRLSQGAGNPSPLPRQPPSLLEPRELLSWGERSDTDRRAGAPSSLSSSEDLTRA